MPLQLLLQRSLQPLTALLLLSCHLVNGTVAEYLMNSFTQVVGAGNYTHFKLTKEGDVRLVLNTLEGDADIYISDTTLFPDFENYELQASTCGEDMVLIPEDFKRPIGIAIYGHPAHELSQFRLDVYIGEPPNTAEQSVPTGFQSRAGSGPKKSHEPEQEDSLLWNIFVGLLKIIFDVLL